MQIDIINIMICTLHCWARRGVPDTTLCDKVYQRLVVGQWFSQDTSGSSANKTLPSVQCKMERQTLEYNMQPLCDFDPPPQYMFYSYPRHTHMFRKHCSADK